MRKHSVRKWIHAILDLLPLLVIPIFAINIINRSPEPLSVEYGDVHTEVNYMYETNEVNSLDDIVIDNLYFASNFDLELDNNQSGNTEHLSFELISFSDVTPYPLSINDEDFYDFYSNAVKVYMYVDVGFMDNSDITIQLLFGDSYVNYSINSSHITLTDCNFRVIEFLSEFKNYYQWSINEYDATLPTSSDFNVIESVEEVHDTVIYNDTDIGSQFMYSLYHVTDKYFNMDDTFNMGSVYQWFTDNVFGGNPPLVVPIVWHVIVYEFIMDLLFLVYAVFMFVIDFAESFMDNLFHRSYRGGR